MPTQRPVTTRGPRPELPRVRWQGLFQEAAYEDGQTYAQPDDEDDEDDDGDD